MNTENTATPRQRWALFCITKKDYRNEILSKEEAARLIKELGDPNYKKASKVSKTLSDELLDYMKDHIDELYQACLGELNYKSIVEDDTHIPENKRKRFAFVGCGCGITWLKYRKSKRAEEIDKAARKFRGEEVLNMLVKKLPKKDYNYLKSIGCPFEAIFYQMQNLQTKYYSLIVRFAETKGIEMRIESRID
jgi:hypothetical protein